MNCGHMCTISLYRFSGSHVQRMLVHVPMYTMYYLSVVIVLHKDVVRLCSYRVKGGGSYNILSPTLDILVNSILVISKGRNHCLIYNNCFFVTLCLYLCKENEGKNPFFFNEYLKVFNEEILIQSNK